MKKILITSLSVLILSTVFLAFKSNNKGSHDERMIYFNSINLSELADTRCLQGCIGEDCEGEGAICTYCTYGNCGAASACTCLDYSANYVQQIAQCLSIPELTPKIWEELSDSQRNSECVVNAIKSHLLPDPDQ